MTDPKDQVTAYTYGTNGWLRSITQPGSAFATQIFSYDGLGNLQSANYGYGDVTYAYDHLNRVTQVQYPAGSEYGNQQQVPAYWVTYQYEKTQGDNNGEKQTTTVYNSSDNIISQVESLTDPLGRLRSEKWTEIDDAPVNYLLTYSYDGAGNLTGLTYPDNQVVTYNYNYAQSAGRLIEIEDYVPSFQYATNGFLKSISFANGNQTVITPDARYRPQQIQTKTSADVTLFNAEYGYDFANNITSINNNPQEYDELNRLRVARMPISSGSHDTEYGYDGAGNRVFEATGAVTKTSDYDPLQHGNAITSVTTGGSTENFSYDQAGAMISREKDGITTTYLHDGAGRLVEVRRDDQTIAQYAYDGHGRLVKTTDSLPTGNRITFRLPMGNETAYEKITEAGIESTRKYIVGNGRYLAKVEREGNGPEEVSYYHNDHLGSIRTVSSADVATMTYDAYGKLIESTGAVDEHNHRYTGKPVDSTGLYYYGARFFDPELGRFITVDPARDGMNWYGYAYNNPLKYVDPTGLAAGDRFSSADLAAIDFGMTYNDDSIRRNRELGATIYLSKDDHANEFYSYTIPELGSRTTTTWSKAPSGTTSVAIIHTHGAYVLGLNSNFFSTVGEKSDIKQAQDQNLDIYVATPNGSLLKYSFQERRIIENPISTALASDPNDPERRNTTDSYAGHSDPVQQYGIVHYP